MNAAILLLAGLLQSAPVARDDDAAIAKQVAEFDAAMAEKRWEGAEALVFYQAFVLRPLVEALRIRHDPWRHDFDVRYLRFDLPADVRERVEALWFVRDREDLAAKHAAASAWLREELATLDVDAVRLPVA